MKIIAFHFEKNFDWWLWFQVRASVKRKNFVQYRFCDTQSCGIKSGFTGSSGHIEPRAVTNWLAGRLTSSLPGIWHHLATWKSGKIWIPPLHPQMNNSLRSSNSTVRPSDSVSQALVRHSSRLSQALVRPSSSVSQAWVPANRSIHQTTRSLNPSASVVRYGFVPVVPLSNAVTICAGCAAARGLPHHAGINTYTRCGGCNNVHHVGWEVFLSMVASVPEGYSGDGKGRCIAS